MTRWVLALSFATMTLHQEICVAGCPTDAIFCDNFNTYCTGGGYPGGAGDPADPDCASPDNPDNALLQSVWFRTSTDELTKAPCGEKIVVDTADTYQAISSPPFAARCPGNADQLMAQHTLKDWVAPNPLNLSRFIGNTFGAPYTAIAGTDDQPVVLSFFVSSKGGPAPLSGRIWYSDGYLELAYGDESYMNRANTDHGLVANPPSSPLCCSPTISQGPFPVMCASGNPDNPAVALPLNCPAPSTALVHNAIAVGVLASLDNDPCHCNSAHGGTINHPVLYDGKLWYEIKSNNPAASTGWVTLLDGTPVPTPPSDLDGLSRSSYRYGNFVLYGGQPPALSGKSRNWITLTIKSTTFKIEMRSQEVSATTGLEYYVHSSMDNIPRRYLGPFDRLRMGVGSGCELASRYSWTTCKSGTARHCLDNNGAQAHYVDFDDLSLRGAFVPPMPAPCCHSNGVCTNELWADCQAPGDVPGSLGAACATTSCCPHAPYVWADADADGDVDADDFAVFQRCFTGPTGAMPSDPKCRCFDRSGNNHVDGGDYLQFARCTTGPDVPWSQNETPDCVP